MGRLFWELAFERRLSTLNFPRCETETTLVVRPFEREIPIECGSRYSVLVDDKRFNT